MKDDVYYRLLRASGFAIRYRCCFVCAKQVNETCGGAFAIDGQCDMKLSCIIQPSHGKLVTGREPGICKRKLLHACSFRESVYIRFINVVNVALSTEIILKLLNVKKASCWLGVDE